MKITDNNNEKYDGLLQFVKSVRTSYNIYDDSYSQRESMQSLSEYGCMDYSDDNQVLITSLSY